MEITPLNILLIVLVGVAIWAVVELAITIRKARASVDEITRSANDTIGQVQPIIAKIDGAVDEIQPAVKQVDPIVSKAQGVIDQANESLGKVNTILGDVSTVSGTAAGVTNVVTQVTSAAADAATGLVSKIRGDVDEGPAAIEGAAEEVPPAEADTAEGYVTYGPAPAKDDEGTGVVA